MNFAITASSRRAVPGGLVQPACRMPDEFSAPRNGAARPGGRGGGGGRP